METTGESRNPPARRRTTRAVKRKTFDSKNEEMTKRKRTFEDFFNFCNFVLAYEQHLATTNGLIGTNSAGESSPSTSSPSPSHTSMSTNTTSESLEDSAPSAEEDEGDNDSGPLSPASQNPRDDKLEYTSDDESWNLITCFCHRPFAGRPMIECSQCQTWIHLFCAKIKKSNVPEVYVCPNCKAANAHKAKRKKSKNGNISSS